MIMGFRHLSAVVLVVAVIATCVSAQALDFTGQPVASCHAMSHPQPSLSPVDYQCCQAGHNAAVVKNAIDAASAQPASHFCPVFETTRTSEQVLLLSVRSSCPPVSPPLLI